MFWLTAVGQSNYGPPMPCALTFRCFLSLVKRLSLAVDGRFGILASHITWNSLLVLLDTVRLYRVYRRLDTLPLYLYYEL